MMPPNSFQQVVAADDLPARKALSELGSAPLPPGARTRLVIARTILEVRRRRRWDIYWGNLASACEHKRIACELAEVGKRAPREQRAPGGNDPSSETGGTGA